MAAPYREGETIYVKPSSSGTRQKGLVTVKTIRAGNSYNWDIHIEYHLTGKSRWVTDDMVRSARPDDFHVGDIITENVLASFDCEIIKIETATGPGGIGFLSFIGNGPIVAEQLDSSGTRCGNIYHLEPGECILEDPVSEDTEQIVIKGPEPIHNQGRSVCYWCDRATEKRLGFHMDQYDVCPICKK